MSNAWNVILSKAVLKSKGWNYKVGMKVGSSHHSAHREGIIFATDGKAVCDIIDSEGNEFRIGGPLPDLGDPGTIGHLLQLAREARNNPLLYCKKINLSTWACYEAKVLVSTGQPDTVIQNQLSTGGSEAACLVQVLLDEGLT